MTNKETRVPTRDPYGSIKAAMSRGVTHYYEDFYDAREKLIMDREKLNGTERNIPC